MYLDSGHARELWIINHDIGVWKNYGIIVPESACTIVRG